MPDGIPRLSKNYSFSDNLCSDERRTRTSEGIPCTIILYHHACALRFSGSCASTIAPNISTQPKISRADSA